MSAQPPPQRRVDTAGWRRAAPYRRQMLVGRCRTGRRYRCRGERGCGVLLNSVQKRSAIVARVAGSKTRRQQATTVLLFVEQPCAIVRAVVDDRSSSPPATWRSL